MANRYKGEVSFKDSLGNDYVLRLSTFKWAENRERLEDLLKNKSARDYQMEMFHLCFVNGVEAQQGLTLEETTEIMDDLGFDEANALVEQTKFWKNVKASRDAEHARARAAAAAAAVTLSSKIDTLKQDATDPSVLKALEEVERAIQAMQPKEQGSANP